jgi:hypothetical protein
MVVFFLSPPDILKFLQSKDVDGREPSLNASTAAAIEMYQVSFVAEPGGTLFKSTALLNIAKGTFKINVNGPSINDFILLVLSF